MSKSRIDKTGMEFGRLTVTKFLGTNGRKSFWECHCSCGNIVKIRSDSLTSGTATSCGCLQRDLATARSTTHGLSRTSEYTTWRGMKDRCYNSNVHNYKDYGGRGVTIHQSWIDSFEQFTQIWVIGLLRHTV